MEKAQFKLESETRDRLRSFKQDHHKLIRDHCKNSKDFVSWNDAINYLLDKHKG